VERAAFPADGSSVGLARAFVRRALLGFRRVDDAELCVSELATNAVRYGSVGGDPFRVVVSRRCGWVYVAVIDSGGPTVPHLVQADINAEGFRGLALVEAYAKRWGSVRDRRGGFRVWFEVVAR
jgi:anti-sigma regulatory factor (Ser/Thr protein kinase)